MTMTVRKQTEEDGTPVMVIRVVGNRSISWFQVLVNRATNCWDSAPADVKEFGDMVVHGRPLQDYISQSGEPKL